jgi:His/Glu/Gln/Arg/opine family amino acid ABC transporter permease subunit
MMPEMVPSPPTGGNKTRPSWRERFGHVPWFRRYEFLGGLFLLLLVLAFFLPPFGRPQSTLVWIEIAVYFLAVLFWVGIILSDIEKPNWMKAIAAVLIVLVFGWLFYQYSGARWDKLAHAFFNWEILSATGSYGSTTSAWIELLAGLWLTLQLAFFSIIFGTILGLVLAVLRNLHDPVLNFFLTIWVDFFRAIPIIVLMMLIYYAFPYLGITLSGVVSGVLTLTLNSSAYISEIFRAGIESIHYGQVEASRALGLTTMQTMRLVILPQAIRVVMPPLASNYVAMLKDTAICSVIAILELLKTAITLQSWLANPTPLVAATALYLVILIPMSRFSSILENRMKARGVSRALASKKG